MRRFAFLLAALLLASSAHAETVSFSPPTLSTLGAAPLASPAFTGSISVLTGGGVGTLSANDAGAYPASGTTSWAITDHFAGLRDVNFWNTDILATTSFSFLQKTGAGAATSLLTISPAGVAVLPGLNITGPPTLSFVSAGETVLFSQHQTTTAASNTSPEGGMHFGLTSATGSANLTTADKRGLSGDVHCNAGSASCWGIATALYLGVGGTQRGGIVYEADLDNAQSSYQVSPGNPYAANFYASGLPSGGFVNNFAFGALAASGPLWHQGFLTWGTNTVDRAAFEDMSTSATATSFLGINGVYVGAPVGSPSLAVPVGILPRRALVHAYIAGGSSIAIESVVENDTSDAGVASYGFSVTNSATETRSTKAGFGYQRGDGNGRGSLLFYNRATNDTGDFTSSDVVATNFNATGNWQFGAPAADAGQKFQVNGTSALTGNATFGALAITKGYTVAGLPAAGTAGARAHVTDQLTECPVLGAALTGGGAVVCPAFDTGAAWVGR